MVYVDGELLGVIGEMRSSVRKSLKLPEFCAGFELDLGLLQSKLSHRHYMPIGQFPKTQQDITLGVGTGTSYEDLHSLLSSELQAAKQAHGYESSLVPRDIYQKDGEASKNLTFRIWLWHPEKTLKTEEANALLDTIALKAGKELGAERI
jgi:phenylalanyl-tRNA synthetase beta subunit